MDGARRKLLHLLWRADSCGRLGVYYPVTEAGEAIYVHAKIMLIDDRLLRVGSSNVNNRSMGFDTECDLAVEADETAKNEVLRETIAAIRRDLLCEHLGVTEDRLTAALDEAGSLLRAIEDLRGEGRSLVSFEADDIEDDDSVLASIASIVRMERRSRSSVVSLSRRPAVSLLIAGPGSTLAIVRSIRSSSHPSRPKPAS